jgi:hypothetical protein
LRHDGKNLTHIDLRSSPLGKKGLNVVLEEIAEVCPKLKVGENSGEKILFFHRCSKVLDLARTPFLGKTNAAALNDVLKKAASLTRLVLSGCSFDKDSWTGFCKVFFRCAPLDVM